MENDYSAASMLPMYAVMFLFVIAAVFCLVNAIRTGAVSGDEAPKFRMLEEDETQARGMNGGKNDSK